MKNSSDWPAAHDAFDSFEFDPKSDSEDGRSSSAAADMDSAALDVSVSPLAAAADCRGFSDPSSDSH